jgi:hypothetical protein
MTAKPLVRVIPLLALAYTLFPDPAASVVPRTVLVEETGWLA